MIIKHMIQGCPKTTFHNFQISTNGRNLVIPPAKYINKETVLFVSETETIIPLPSLSETTQYELWITPNGFALLSKTANQEFGEMEEPIDRLAWFTLPAGSNSLDDQEIHVVEVIS